MATSKSKSKSGQSRSQKRPTQSKESKPPTGKVYRNASGEQFKVQSVDDDGNVVLEETRPDSAGPDPSKAEKKVLTTTETEFEGGGWEVVDS